jgi:DNA polymerase III delta prime subunit
MRKKQQLITIILIILAVLLTLASGPVGNAIELPKSVKPFTLPLFLSLAFVLSIIAVCQYFIQKMAEHTSQTVSSQNRQRMLERVHAFWIADVLEQSLHGAALIALGLQEQPDAVANPWRLVLQQPDQSERLLPPDTRITQVYDRAGGELLILGEPGSGKTTLLLEMARDLLDRAQKDNTQPMPVVFNLSSWAAKRQSITDWMIEELKTKYQVPDKLGRSWVGADQILPLLDGLDEVAKEYRAVCVDAINAYRHEHMVPIVVCSRITEYLSQTSRVQVRCAVVVQPLTTRQIDDYLASAGGQLAAVRVALRKDTELRELATTPLMLSVLTLTYQGKSVEDILIKDSFGTRRRQVLKTYVQRMLQRRGTETRYTTQQTMYWLTWLAKRMEQHSQTEFYIERMQPDWLLDTRLHFIYHIAVGLFLALVVWLVCAPIFGPIGGLILGLISGLLIETKEEIEPKEIITWSRQIARKGLVGWLINVLLSGLAVGLAVGLAKAPIVGLISGLVSGLISGLVIGLLFGLSSKKMDKHNLVTPNQGIWRSARNGILIGLVIGLISGLVSILISGQAIGLFVGLLGVLVVGLLFGLDAFIGHFILRFFLWRAGSIPLNYPRFLDHAAERILLRKVGGGYIFVHRLLLEYFASLDTTH